MRGFVSDDRAAVPVPCVSGGHVLDDLAEHQLDDLVLRALRHVDDADRRPFAQDRRAVAHRRDLDHPVGDEDDGAVAASLPRDHLEDPLGQVRGQGRGHLVEHQHVRLGTPGRVRGR